MIQTISTHRGTYRMHRPSFGIKTAPSEFNRILSQILKGLPKTESYFDDIIIHYETLQECTENLEACLQGLSDYDLHINKQKCSFFQEKIEYLGHVIEYNKISKSPTKIQAVQEMPRPSNIEEIKRFLGLVTYYSRFMPNFSTISYPLRRLLRKNQPWLWTASCESAFLKLKNELTSDRVLVPFDTSLPIVLTTDASPTGIAAVLSHSKQGVERPIAYASRSLTNSEYSEFTLFDGILFRRERVVIPKSLRSNILKELHETHLGITKMKQLARQYVYWPAIDRDIENLVKGCEGCALTKSNPPKVSVHPWESPADNWDRIHIDYAGPFENYYFLVCVDAKSKWVEVESLKMPQLVQKLSF
nr:uncharacterized protein K02A2.6-like [Parasteatoda tepidariorum]